MTNYEFTQRLIDIVNNYKTLYIMGCFGAPITSGNVERYCNNYAYNRQTRRTNMIKAAADQKPPVFGFDCVCLIKGVLWGWNGNAAKTYGGAVYNSNGVPDSGANTMFKKCEGISEDFSSLMLGEMLWLQDHCGIYAGNGLAVECSPAFENRVQITAVGNLGKKSGYNTRTWKKHGRLPYITYIEAGDIDSDGKITAADARSALRMATGLEADSPVADVDGDGSITAKDAREILRKATGLE